MPREDNIGLICRDKDGQPYATRPPTRFTFYEKLAVSTVAVALAAVPDGADSVRLRIEANDVRWRSDVAPTASDGELFKTTDPVLVLENVGNAGLRTLKFIRATADAVLHVTYYRVRA